MSVHETSDATFEQDTATGVALIDFLGDLVWTVPDAVTSC